MPKAVRAVRDPEVEYAAALLRASDEFEAGFRRNSNRNARRWEGRTLTVFKQPSGGYTWSISDGEGVRFSPGSYDDEAGAIGGLWRSSRCLASCAGETTLQRCITLSRNGADRENRRRKSLYLTRDYYLR